MYFPLRFFVEKGMEKFASKEKRYFSDRQHFQKFQIKFVPVRINRKVWVFMTFHFHIHAPQYVSNFRELGAGCFWERLYHGHSWGKETIENDRVNCYNNNCIQCCTDVCVNHVSIRSVTVKCEPRNPRENCNQETLCYLNQHEERTKGVWQTCGSMEWASSVSNC